MVDFKGAIESYVDDSRVFVDQNKCKAIVIHKTAGFNKASDCAAFFANTPTEVSSTYIVGLDGEVIQCVREKDGAGANCCLENGHDGYWDQFNGANLNLFTISIEHIDPSNDNSSPLTGAQKRASFALVQDICSRRNISYRDIKTHSSIAPTSRARCPGNYPFEELVAFIKDNPHVTPSKPPAILGVPRNWSDDGETLWSPDHIPVKWGFREFILNNNWDYQDTPLYPESWCSTLEESHKSMGSGTEQLFRMSRLCWQRDENRVYKSWIGQELDWWRKKI